MTDSLEPSKSFFVLWDGSPEGLDPDERQAMIDATADGRLYDSSWSFGRGYGNPLAGDRVFLLRTGNLRGVVASASITKDGVVMDDHWTGTGKRTAYIDVTWDVMVGDDDRLTIEELRQALPEFKFPVLGSGRRIYDPSAASLENLWGEHVDDLGRRTRNPWLGGRPQSRQQRVSRRIPLQRNMTPSYDVESFASHRARRAESELVDRFVARLRPEGLDLSGFQLQVEGVNRPLLVDLFDHTNNVLYEAKASASREAVRMALGQLLDYRRHIETSPSICMLLPDRPADDLVELLREYGVGCVCEESNRFEVVLKSAVAA
ncbi:hypothetical protein [Rhodococcus sp. 14-2470-1b]|uniref:hypothetical protein n=1 Tax=Rhodococcus sp. 14-2470-1b TaxID=2023149 RepID=UPI00113FFBD3|nr:hypothetical protein [Rhodococcus sp. 14-2470-1b]